MSELHRFARQLIESLDAHAPGALAGPLPVTEISERYLPYRACRRQLGIRSIEEYDLLLLRLVAGESGLASAVPAEAAELCQAELEKGAPDLAVLARFADVSLLLDRDAITFARSARAEEEGGPVRAYELRELESEAEVPRGDAAEVAESGRSEEAVPSAGATLVDAPDSALFEAVDIDAGKIGPGAEEEAASRQEEEEGSPGPPVSEPAAAMPQDAVPDQTLPDAVAEPERAPDPVPAPPGALAPPRCPHCASRLPTGRPVRFCPHCGGNVVPLQCARCQAELEPSWRHCVLCGAPAMHDSRFA